MMSDLANKVIMRMDLSLRVILLYEVVYKISCMHDLLLISIALGRQIIEAIIILPRAALLVLIL